MISRQRFPELMQRPFRRRMGRHVLVDNLSGSNLYDDEAVEGAERGGDHHEEVASYHGLGMITDEGQVSRSPSRFGGLRIGYSRTHIAI
jgi:hypothetical protein